jgi:hypothetical protein
MCVPTVQREDDRFKNGGHGAKSAFAHPTVLAGNSGQPGDLTASACLTKA